MSFNPEAARALHKSAEIVCEQARTIVASNGHDPDIPIQAQGYQRIANVLESLADLANRGFKHEPIEVNEGTIGVVKNAGPELFRKVYNPNGQSILELAIGAIHCGNVELVEQLFGRQGQNVGLLQLRDIDDAYEARERLARQSAGNAGWPFR